MAEKCDQFFLKSGHKVVIKVVIFGLAVCDQFLTTLVGWSERGKVTSFAGFSKVL